MRSENMDKILLVYLAVIFVDGQNINSKSQGYWFDGTKNLTISCGGHELNNTWIAHPRPTSYETVSLIDCTVPEGSSYAAALDALNIAVGDALELNQLRTAPALGALPAMRRLRLHATRNMHLPLQGVPGLRALDLTHVHADSLPPGLHTLRLVDADYRVLPAQALNVTELEIVQVSPISFIGEASGLQSLSVIAPVQSLPPAPTLRHLTLVTDNLPDLPCPRLEQLKISRLRSPILHSGFLDAPQLVNFSATQSKFSRVAPDLFLNFPNLEFIDLSDNEIESLYKKLFAGLSKLKVLRLSDNQLRSDTLPDMKSLSALTQLDLSRNPLGDLCSETKKSPLSSLKNLDTLELVQTGATRVCADWFALRVSTLNMRHNVVRRVSCAALRQQDARDVAYPLLELKGNPVEVVDCSQEDYDSGVDNRFSGKLSIDSQLKCDCGSYWLARLVRERRASVVSTHPLANPNCSEEWFHCMADPPVKKAWVENYTVEIEEKGVIKISCNNGVIDNPKVERPTRFNTTWLFDCPPPANDASFAAVLGTLNVYLGRTLKIFRLPEYPHLSAGSFRSLPSSLTSLTLQGGNRLTWVQEGALAGLVGIRDLHFRFVQATQLPPALKEFQLLGTMYKKLPPQAVNVVVLKISDSNTVLSEPMPRLKTMWTYSSPSIPPAPELKTLFMFLLSENQLSQGFLGKCPKLRKLMLAMYKGELPIGLLRNATKLRSFALEESSTTRLPADLFHYSPQLRIITLIHNYIKTLPIDVFSKVPNLKELWLSDNWLKATDLRALAPLTSLTILRIDKNPLGDKLCANSTLPLSTFKKLKVLKAMNIGLTQICPDWRNLKYLTDIRVRNNNIRSVACADLVVEHAAPYLDLKDNELEHVHCTREDYERFVDPFPKQVMQLVVDPFKLECDCGGYWMTRMAEHLVAAGVKSVFNPQLAYVSYPCNEKCT